MKPYYENKGITIYHGDCREILPHLPKVDLVLTSPPYDSLRDYKGYTFDFEGIAVDLAGKIVDGGIIVWVVGDMVKDGSESLTSFKQAIYFKEVCGLNVHDTMIYEKDTSPFPESNRYWQTFEYMFVFSNGSPRTSNLLKIKTRESNRIKRKTTSYRNKDGTTSYGEYETGKEEKTNGV